MANNHIATLSLNPTSISDFTGTNVSEGMARNLVNNAMRQFGSMVKADFAANAGTITSASTLSLASISTGDYILLQPSGGSNSITSFGAATEGLVKRLEALGTVILRNSSNMLLPGGTDLTISTGDIIVTRAMGASVHKVVHEPFNGVAQSIINAVSATVSATTKLLAVTGGVPSTALVSEIAALANINTAYLALSAAHTISVGNRDAVLDFTTAGVTCAIVPVASLSAGFQVTVMNTAASGDVTLNPDGVETLDGLATRLLRPGDRAKLVVTGAALKTVAGIYSYTSADTSFSASHTLALAHGLGVAPKAQGVCVALVNVSADLNYSTGDVVHLGVLYAESGNGARTLGVYWDATNVNVLIGALPIFIPDKTTRAASVIDPTKWKLRATAEIPMG
jgi:hypothetical protein